RQQRLLHPLRARRPLAGRGEAKAERPEGPRADDGLHARVLLRGDDAENGPGREARDVHLAGVIPTERRDALEIAAPGRAELLGHLLTLRELAVVDAEGEEARGVKVGVDVAAAQAGDGAAAIDVAAGDG